MKKHFLILSLCLSLLSCKMVMKGAAKHWTRKQIKEFEANCEEFSSKLIGAERAEVYCDCALTLVAEKYNNYEDVKKAGLAQVLKNVKGCSEHDY